MRAKCILHDLLGEKLKKVHRRRVKAVFEIVEAVLRDRCLSLTAIGRSLACIQGIEKHAIKRVDRLLGNHHLSKELAEYFRAIATTVISTNTHCIVLVDWTKIHANLSVLSASIPVGGRSIGIYHEVHPKRLENNRKVHHNFIRRLSTIIPSGCTPIVVTDAGAGFRIPWFKKVRKLGWHYVGRFSGTTFVQVRGSSEWRKAPEFWTFAKQDIPVHVGTVSIAQSSPMTTQLVVYKAKPKGRKGHRGSNRKGVHSAMCGYKRCQRRNSEPWLLCTSLPANEPSGIVQIYATRMQCEESFRDAKSHRFGLGFEDVRTSSPERTSIILLLSSLAQLVSFTVGRAAEQQGLSKHFQANTVKTRRVISQVFLGMRVFSSIQRWKLTLSAIRTALRSMQGQILLYYDAKTFLMTAT